MKHIATLSAMAFLMAGGFIGSTLAEDAKAKPYPLDTCIVSGEKLGSMGKPIVIEHEGQQVAFCCKSCVPKFEKDPANYLKKLPKN